MLHSPYIRQAFELALHEDLALGDITSAVTVDAGLQARGTLLAKQPLVICGLAIVPALISASKMDLYFATEKADGQSARTGDMVGYIEGEARSVLAIERTLLNVMQRLCAIATNTQSVTKRLKKLSVLDTRKTAPGFRMLDKYAVRIGGGKNHRSCLGDMVLVKNNHVDCQSGETRSDRMKQALDKVVLGKPPYMSFEVEVRDFDELTVALNYNPTVIMLDNFGLQDLERALAEVKKSKYTPMVEVSGGITPERCVMLEELGVEYVSMGALTHSVDCADLSLRVEKI